MESVQKRHKLNNVLFLSYLHQLSLYRTRRKKNVRTYVKFYSFKNCGLLYSRVVAGAEPAGAASKFSRGAGAA
jgi:hypothetical protein